MRDTMIVCLCHRVSDRDIASEAAAGCASFDELQDSLRVGTACGACLSCAREVFAQHHESPCGRRVVMLAVGAPEAVAA
jgi:bacterioferritin-associated ferredoxin